jgi:hypothetical protein
MINLSTKSGQAHLNVGLARRTTGDGQYCYKQPKAYSGHSVHLVFS